MNNQPTVADRDPVGTTYLAPDGSTYRITKYEAPIEDLIEHGDDATELPVYDYWGPTGGAAGGITSLPEGCVRVVLPTPERPLVGSLFLTPDGVAYRQRTYSTDWDAVPFTGDLTKPSYSVLLPNGRSTNADTLPADARLVWAPDADVKP